MDKLRVRIAKIVAHRQQQLNLYDARSAVERASERTVKVVRRPLGTGPWLCGLCMLSPSLKGVSPGTFSQSPQKFGVRRDGDRNSTNLQHSEYRGNSCVLFCPPTAAVQRLHVGL